MPSAAVRDGGALQMRPAPCGYSSAQRPLLPRGGCRRRRLGEKSPPQRRKLHIRCLLLPFQTVTASLGHSLGRADRVVRPYGMLRIRKKPFARHHQDSVRRVVASGEVIWGGEKDWASELLHDGSTVYATGFESSLSFLHRARQFFSFSKRERKEWGRKSDGQGRFRCSRKSQTVLFDRTGP